MCLYEKSNIASREFFVSTSRHHFLSKTDNESFRIYRLTSFEDD
jgi:hypothetical protein